jgi:hypothetical protein
VVAVLVLLLALLAGVAGFLTARISPVHVAVGRPFAVAGVTYRVIAVRHRGGRVLVTVQARAATPLVACPAVAAFELDEAGRSYDQLVRYFDPRSQRWMQVATSGCFSDRDVTQPSTRVPPQVQQALAADITRRYARLIRSAGDGPQAQSLKQQAELELIERQGLDANLAEVMAAGVPDSVQHVWSFWWRVQPPPFWRQWTIPYRAPFNQRMSLVVRATGGFHLMGDDRYAVVAL